MLTFGDATIDTMTDLDPFVLPVDLLFPGRSLEVLRAHAAMLSPHHVDFDAETILLGVHSHLLRVNGLMILIDTCIGEHKQRPRRADWHQRQATGYLTPLAAAGLRPQDVDIVLCTHLHADHVGWNTQLVDGRWVPTFPKARYLIGRTEFDTWQAEEAKAPGHHNHGAFNDSVLPVVEAGIAEWVDDGFELGRNLSLMALPGHTTGQLGLCLCEGARKAFFCADAIHSPVQVYQPDWASRFCSDPEIAIATRRTLLDRVAGTDDLLIPAHLRQYSAMKIARTPDGFAPDWVP
ncbi:MBL fold metallo-hydrolase [Neorhizobium sp. DAR64860/K0K1]|uniref:MBL fold metallo-hydrolase n=1 Tax=Neorhizobium sp. DAR64860/K0K1 TaxID=3421955 RepID=UPI003D27FBC8